jgi:F0F1-type ATP synthase membrane subunit c/vacuolar-type H+-ATPase subunit K|tara:strand:- start:514 stop:798 length:285 start_codon:yes stop_codon:yes gene_type:complete
MAPPTPDPTQCGSFTDPTNKVFDLETITAYKDSYCGLGCYRGWADVFECTDPNSWSSIGIAIGMGFSIIGSGAGMLIAGSTINASSIKTPRINS